MIADLKPYLEYQEAGLQWLSLLPSNWRLLRGKSVFTLVDVRSKTGMEELLTVSANYGVIPRRQTSVTMFKAKSYIGHKLCWPGDFVVNSLWAWMQGLGVSNNFGLISSAYSVYRSRPEYSEYGRFFHYLLRSDAYKWELQTRSKGVWISRLQLSDLAFMDMPLLLPLPSEQAAIVRFLDHITRRIERTIHAKRKVIALLNEQKQAIIHRAVTRGLEPNVRLKSSSIPWLGEIPEHWELWRISRLAKVGNGSTPSRAKPFYWHGGSYPWLNSANVNRGFIDSADQFVTKTALQECHLPRVPAGSVLIAITGQGKTRGTVAVLGIEATINQHIAFITPRLSIVTPDFLHLVLTAAYYTLRALSEDSGSTKGALTCEDLKRFKIAIPPRSEQAALVEYIQKATHALRTTISRTEREIDLLREYRTRLIADVVTGKLDVREAAARLPDEAEKLEFFDEINDSVEIEEMDAVAEGEA